MTSKKKKKKRQRESELQAKIIFKIACRYEHLCNNEKKDSFCYMPMLVSETNNDSN